MYSKYVSLRHSFLAIQTHKKVYLFIFTANGMVVVTKNGMKMEIANLLFAGHV